MPAYLGEDESVIVRVLRVHLFIPHDVEKQHRHDLSSTAAHCGVAERHGTGRFSQASDSPGTHTVHEEAFQHMVSSNWKQQSFLPVLKESSQGKGMLGHCPPSSQLVRMLSGPGTSQLLSL